MIGQRPTSLSVDEVSETERVIHAFDMYWKAQNSLQKVGRTSSVPEPNFNVPTTAGLEAEIQRYFAASPAATTLPTTVPAER